MLLMLDYYEARDNVFDIKGFYSTLRKEILDSGFMSIREWKIHLHKANEYMRSNKVRNMIYHKKYDKIKLYITLEHILCIILYCDTNDLQSHFSATFRKKHQYETIDELKKRHQKYHHFAKLIVEAIHFWGIDGDELRLVNSLKPQTIERGPFYCGLNRALNIGGQYKILFAAPISTSKDIEVAIKFATRDGLIMEIENDFGEGYSQNVFDCSWISRYSEENERLFVANRYKLRIESITIIETGTNITLFFEVLELFDYILRGHEYESEKLDKFDEEHHKYLNSLLSNVHIDEYILNNFNSYLSQKSIITLNMDCLHRLNIESLFYLLSPNNEFYYHHDNLDDDWNIIRMECIIQNKAKSLYIESWSKRTDFSRVSLIGYLCDDGRIIELECITQNRGNNRIMVRFTNGNCYKYKWLDIPNERIYNPYSHYEDRRKIVIHKYYEESECVDKYYEEIRMIRFEKNYIEYIDGFIGLNIMHLNVLKLFKNIKSIKIDVGYHGKYKFDLLSFLSVIIWSGKRDVIYIIKAKSGVFVSHTWIGDCITPVIASAYQAKRWDIEYGISESGELRESIVIKPFKLAINTLQV